VDIIDACRNGVLVDPLDPGGIAEALLHVLEDRGRWREFSRRGIEGANEHYSWRTHVTRYVERVRDVQREARTIVDLPLRRPRPLSGVDRMIVADVDNTLIGDDEALARFASALEGAGDEVGFAVATGRSTRSARELLDSLDIPGPHVLITGVGTEIHYGDGMTPDRSWRRHIDHRWEPERILAVLEDIPGVNLQDPEDQGAFKISFGYDAEEAPPLPRLRRLLRGYGIRCKLVLSHGMFLDVVAIRASAGQAIRFLGFKWNLPPERFLVAGDAGNDEDMLRGNTLGVVVGNYSEELEVLRGFPRVFFAEGSHANGILEGIEHYDFFDRIRVPEEDSP
jgi:sucrose-phosphate synthase